MGLSIHYSGFILKSDLIKPLTEEVRDICTDLGWTVKILNDDEIYGVIFFPEKCEPVSLTFNKDGRLLSPQNIVVKDIYDGEMLDKELIFTTSTKTQYAGIEAHIAIIKLLKYLSQKYMKDFVLKDEGLFWETGDERILKEQFDRFIAAISFVSEALKGMPAKEGESAESLIDRIEKILKKNLNKKKE